MLLLQQAKAEFPNGPPLPQARPAAANNPTGTGKLPSRDNASDAYDRAQESVQKYTARIQAEADAQGLSNEAMEEAKAKAQLLTAAQQAGIPVTQATTDKINDLAQKAGAANGLHEGTDQSPGRLRYHDEQRDRRDVLW